MKFLILGGNFENKGAQSMLFIAVDQIRRLYPEAEILYRTDEVYDYSNYKFTRFRMSKETIRIAIGGAPGVCARIVRLFKDCIKFCVNMRRDLFVEFSNAKELKKLDCIVDISGFALGDKWSYRDNIKYLLNLELADKLDIPMFIMPQSIGPFEYEKVTSDLKAKKLRSKLCKHLQHSKVIFVREKDGLASLADIGVKENVKLSYDLVLQNKDINIKNVYKKMPQYKIPEIPTKNNVAIIPNKQLFVHGKADSIMNVYKKIVKKLTDLNKEIYIVKHSKLDREICEDIYNDNRSLNVHLINEELSCLEYDMITTKFEFIIGARFHGIVHALRNDVPCIALGWAVKYETLMKEIGLEKFVFDVTSNEFVMEDIIESIELLDLDLSEFKNMIKCNLDAIQTYNCFDVLRNI